MHVLGISGSPRKDGNTEILLNKALSGLQEKGLDVEKIRLNDLKIAPCQECDVVNDDGTCRVEDDFQSLYNKIMNADILILASPIFFGSVSAQMKIMIDRFQCYWRYKFILKKVGSEKKKNGAFIAVEASDRKDFFENAKSIVKNLFVTIGVNYKEELLCMGVEEKGSVLTHTDCLDKASHLSKNIL